MTYAAESDLIARFGEQEIILLSDDTNSGVTNDAVIAQALSDVDAVIDGYLGNRYALPLSPVPEALVPIACDLARYRLATRNGNSQATDTVKDRNAAAIAWLRDVAKGNFSLGLTAAGAELPSTGLAKSTTPCRRFTAETLESYEPLRDRWGRRWFP